MLLDMHAHTHFTQTHTRTHACNHTHTQESEHTSAVCAFEEENASAGLRGIWISRNTTKQQTLHETSLGNELLKVKSCFKRVLFFVRVAYFATPQTLHETSLGKHLFHEKDSSARAFPATPQSKRFFLPKRHTNSDTRTQRASVLSQTTTNSCVHKLTCINIHARAQTTTHTPEIHNTRQTHRHTIDKGTWLHIHDKDQKLRPKKCHLLANVDISRASVVIVKLQRLFSRPIWGPNMFESVCMCNKRVTGEQAICVYVYVCMHKECVSG